MAPIVAFLIFALTSAAFAGDLPRFDFRAPPELAAEMLALESIDPAVLEPALRLTGFDRFAIGAPERVAPIVVHLVRESSPHARAAPRWIAGYASGGIGAGGEVVLFPARAGGYPDRGLVPLFRHELTHILVHRAAGGNAVPRWFNEGLAMAAAGENGLGDRARLTLAVLRDGSLPIARLDRAFAGGETAISSAYALAGDLVRELLSEQGDDAGARILERLARGERFDDAFRGVAGRGVADFERDYWSDRTLWDRWVPILSSSVLLWGAIAFLALAAFRRRRLRDRVRLAKWSEEEKQQRIRDAAEGVVKDEEFWSRMGGDT